MDIGTVSDEVPLSQIQIDLEYLTHDLTARQLSSRLMGDYFANLDGKTFYFSGLSLR